ncbi:MAG: hypothetical protein NTW87_21030, partial [Planctomycetota bacterium]|nr:hypothetical protein [Planctomycetota bacterium]
MRRLVCATVRAATLTTFFCFGVRALAEEPATVVLDTPETAGISAFRPMWDQPVVTAADGVRVITDSVIKDRGGTAAWHPKVRDNGAKPGALAFDALRRSLLVRFPGAAEKIAAKLNEGYSIAKVELVLPFKDEELWPEGSTGGGVGPEGGYEYRANWGVDELYRKHRPTWSALASALRKPWKADAQSGPTFNAYIAGVGYWKKCGASSPTIARG